jgi:DNA-binding MarR family transcriptional regulator
MFRELDPLLHNPLRLSVMSLLITLESAEFNYLLEKTGATAGNLSVQINKLKEADYIRVQKSFKKNYPLTTCKITPSGIDAFEKYVDALQDYLSAKKDKG